jgi:RNA polymerase sigma-70 factor (ECF subfamily)
MSENAFIPTRRSLLSRLRSWEHEDSWREFFDIYWRLVYNFAVKAGLDDAAAQDVVQETIISVAEKLPTFKYDPSLGSFKGWLLQIARRRVADHLRARYRAGAGCTVSADDTSVRAKLCSTEAPSTSDLELIWEGQWREHIAQAATDRIKRQIRPEQFQIFDLAVLQRWPARQVAQALGVTLTQVYMARHRVGRMIAKEVRRLEKKVI